MIILEAQIQCEIQKITTNKEKEADLIIKELLNKIPAIIKDKSQEEVKYTEFPKLREIQNTYRTTVSKLDTAKARCLDITHEILEISINKSKERKKTKPGRPPKIKEIAANNKDITDYFIKQEN